MYTDTEGIILRQIKTVDGRRMIVLFSKKYGKISAGTSISERGKNKSSLALRPFTLGRYELYKNRDNYNINGAETLQSYYSLGENVDKYLAASYILELTDLLLTEEQSAPGMFNLLCDFLGMLETRKNSFDTLLIAFQIKALSFAGIGINASNCIKCGEKKSAVYLSVPDGGYICEACASSVDKLNPLIFPVTNDIISVTEFMEKHPLKSLETLGLSAEKEAILKRIMRKYYSYHLGIENLKSEGLKI